MMNENWIQISSYGCILDAEIAKTKLEENNVDCVLINKKDSSYNFGEIELFVKKMQENIAKDIISINHFVL